MDLWQENYWKKSVNHFFFPKNFGIFARREGIFPKIFLPKDHIVDPAFFKPLPTEDPAFFT